MSRMTYALSTDHIEAAPMNHALRACLLIRLAACTGDAPVLVDDLATYMQMPATLVRAELGAMWHDGLVELVQDAGGIFAAKVAQR